MANRPRTLKEWMDRRGLDDAALAQEVGVSRSQINRIRNRASLPSLETARALEAVTRIPAAKFMLGEA